MEIYGESGTGKTEVLLHIVVRALLPDPSESIAATVSEPKFVLYFDLGAA